MLYNRNVGITADEIEQQIVESLRQKKHLGHTIPFGDLLVFRQAQRTYAAEKISPRQTMNFVLDSLLKQLREANAEAYQVIQQYAVEDQSMLPAI